MRNRKNGPNTDHGTDGRFVEGNSGRPKGARHKTSVAVEALLQGEAEGLTRKAVELALDGDTTALRLCLERIAPPRKDSPITFDVPEVSNASGAAKAMGAILESVATGQITPDEARSVASLIETYRKVLETEELERRISALEAAK